MALGLLMGFPLPKESFSKTFRKPKASGCNEKTGYNPLLSKDRKKGSLSHKQLGFG
jgi:hypothetical protein